MLVGAAAWIAWRRTAQNVRDEHLQSEVQLEGTVVIPVTGTEVRGGFFSKMRNSIKPLLSIDREGIRFRVLKKDRWLFSEIERIDVRKALFGVRIIFTRGDGCVLTAQVRHMDIAKLALAALPPGLRITAAAAALRDSANGASSSSL